MFQDLNMLSFFGHRGIHDTQPASTDFAKGGGGKGRRSAVILRCWGTACASYAVGNKHRKFQQCLSDLSRVYIGIND